MLEKKTLNVEVYNVEVNYNINELVTTENKFDASPPTNISKKTSVMAMRCEFSFVRASPEIL